jgi:hypothetical protein
MAIDATPGGASADSFISLADADAYHSTDQIHTNVAWSALSTASKEAALKMATRIIDTMSFLGQRVSISQALSWPRQFALFDGIYLDATTVPDRVQWATAELANWLAVEDRAAPSAGNKLSRVAVGSIEVEFRQTAAGILSDMPDTVVKFLRPLVTGSVRGAGQPRVVV